MATLDDARAGVTRHIERHLQRDIEYGYLAIVVDGIYVFDITNDADELIKPGYVHCRIEAGLSFEPSECIPRVALDPYTRCKFKRVAGVLEAVEFVAQDAVRNYADQAAALGVASHPLPNRGSVDLDASVVAYTPATPADYNVTPDHVDGALDELASRVEALETGGGPSGIGDGIVIQEQLSTTTDAGTFTSGSWVKRALNTVVTNVGSHASLSSNQITLAAGTYRLNASAPAFSVNENQIRFYNVTDSTEVAAGTSEYANATNSVSSRSCITDVIFTIAGTKVLELQHQCRTSQSGNGLGVGNTFGSVMVYATVSLVKLA